MKKLLDNKDDADILVNLRMLQDYQPMPGNILECLKKLENKRKQNIIIKNELEELKRDIEIYNNLPRARARKQKND